MRGRRRSFDGKLTTISIKRSPTNAEPMEIFRWKINYDFHRKISNECGPMEIFRWKINYDFHQKISNECGADDKLIAVFIGPHIRWISFDGKPITVSIERSSTNAGVDGDLSMEN